MGGNGGTRCHLVMQATEGLGPGPGLTHSHTLPPKSNLSLWLKLAMNWGPKGVGGEAPTAETVRQRRTRGTMGIVETQSPSPPDSARAHAAPHWGTAGGGGCGLHRGARLAAAASHLGGSPAAPGAPQTAAPALAPIPGEGGRQKPGRWPRYASPEQALGPTQISGAPHPPRRPFPGPDASACRDPMPLPSTRRVLPYLLRSARRAAPCPGTRRRRRSSRLPRPQRTRGRKPGRP